MCSKLRTFDFYFDERLKVKEPQKTPEAFETQIFPEKLESLNVLILLSLYNSDMNLCISRLSMLDSLNSIQIYCQDDFHVSDNDFEQVIMNMIN